MLDKFKDKRKNLSAKMLANRLRRAFSFQKIHQKMHTREGYLKEVDRYNEPLESKFKSFKQKFMENAPNHKKKLLMVAFFFLSAHSFNAFQEVATYLIPLEPAAKTVAGFVLGKKSKTCASLKEFSPGRNKVGRAIKSAELRKLIEDKYVEYDKRFYFGVSKKLVVFLEKNEDKLTAQESIEGVMLPEFGQIFAGKEFEDVNEIFASFEKNEKMLKDWEFREKEAVDEERMAFFRGRSGEELKRIGQKSIFSQNF